MKNNQNKYIYICIYIKLKPKIRKKAKFNLYENSHVTGEFRGSDIDCLELFVRNLETPLGIIPEAILRTNDIISMEVENIINN